MNDCIFCAIAQGASLAHMIWQDEKYMAFLSIFPNTKGFTVVIPKAHQPSYFADVASGKKNYDLRLNDFEANEGDTLLLEEWDPETKQYTGRSVEKKVTYVGKFKIDQLFWPEEEIRAKGIQIISLE